MNITAGLIVVGASQLWLGVVFALHRVKSDRPRMVTAAVLGAPVGAVLGMGVARFWFDRWDYLAVLIAAAVTANTIAASIALTTRSVVESLRRRTGARSEDAAPRSRTARPGFSTGWLRLPLAWKLADMIAALVLVSSAAVTLNTSAVGNPPPVPLRALDAVLSLGAWAILIVSAVKAWRLGRAPSDARPPTHNGSPPVRPPRE